MDIGGPMDGCINHKINRIFISTTTTTAAAAD